jgi:predicted phosphodiesterase
MSDKTIVVGDEHVGPGQNLRRADWLARLIDDVKPDRVVHIGDMGTFDSLSGWDKDKRRKMEGRRYAKDISALSTYVSRLDGGRYQKYQSILLEGNHEDRIARYLDYNPVMEGQLDYASQCGIADKWKIIPFREYYKHYGVSFTHVPIMENGKPISGKLATSRALEICRDSVVFGHTHKLDYVACHRHGQTHLQEALNVGCYFEHVDEYAQGSVTSYWRGLVVLDHYSYGRFSFEAVPMGMLKREYNNEKK